MRRSYLCDYSDVYDDEKGDYSNKSKRKIVDIRNRLLAFKNNASFTNCISKINNVLIDNAEDLDIVMPMYNLLEYSKNYRKTTGSFWNYYRVEANNHPLNDNDPPTINYNAYSIIDSDSFKYKSSITRKTSDANEEHSEKTERGKTKIKKILKLLFHKNIQAIFGERLDMSLINCEVPLTLTWSENCVLTNITT